MRRILLGLSLAALSLAALPANAGHRYHHHGYNHGHYYDSGHRYGPRYRRGYRYGHRYGYRYASRHRDRAAAYAVGGLLLGALLVDSAERRSRGPEVVDRRVVNSNESAGPIANGPLPSTYFRLDGDDCLLIETEADGRRKATPVARNYCD